MQPTATPEQRAVAQEHALLCQVLEHGGHPGRLVGGACARNRKESITFGHPGWGLEATTLRGGRAWYVDWHGPAAERAAQLGAYAATLTAAGWTAIGVQRWPTGPRVRWRLAWAPPAGTAVSLLVAAPHEAMRNEE